MPRPTLADHFRLYADYHRHPLNELTHRLAIPLIVFHTIAMLSWISLGAYSLGSSLTFSLTLAHVAYVAAIGWYLSLDAPLGVLMALLVGLCFPIAAVTPRAVVIGLALVAWIVQLAGHVVWEKRAPAFLTNLFQALIGPLYFVAVAVGRWPQHGAEARA